MPARETIDLMQNKSKKTNRLALESSPYLRQHAENPVDWYPWSEEAFQRAKEEDKPVLVSLGYSACHWCHVMAHESFEDAETAEIMNRHFINVKVDIEERPDVDQVYMNFVQITTGRGGWPLNVFVTPEKVPFFGGTYFPPLPRHGMPSWKQVLLGIADAWLQKRDEVIASAFEILSELKRLSETEADLSPVGLSLCDGAFKTLSAAFDRANGGFGGAPKFPPSMTLEFLLRYWKRSGDQEAIQIVRKTADSMAAGGIYDQLGGGFHRYSVDAFWLVPHFEKMLYDNAQLARIYLHLYQAVKEPFYRRIAEEILDYVLREMTSSQGGFYSSQDADSEGEEGKFFVWTPKEIRQALEPDDPEPFLDYFGVTEDGNFEGKNILKISRKDSLYNALDDRVAKAREKLFQYREKRVKPFRDEKILTSWNGLMLAAMAEAAAALNNQNYLDAACKNADFLLNLHTTFSDGAESEIRVFRTLKSDGKPIQGFLDDYANLADGLIEVFQCTGKTHYLKVARLVAERMLQDFWDEENGGFYYTAKDSEELIVRNKDIYDNATPSGNSVAADILLRLARFFNDEKYERYANATLRAVARQIKRFPQGFGRALSAIEFAAGKVREIVIVGEAGNDLERAVRSKYLPLSIIAPVRSEPDATIPVISGRVSIDDRPTIYICENYVCQRPVTSVSAAIEMLEDF